MTDQNKIPTPLEIANDLLNPFKDVLLKGGIDDKLLIRQLKKELRSKEPKIIKVKGSVRQEDLPPGFKVIADSGTVYEGERGAVNLDGETVIQYNVHNIGVSQRARMDVHKLRGDYPVDKHEVEITDKQAIAAIMESLPDKIRTQVTELVKEKLKAKRK